MQRLTIVAWSLDISTTPKELFIAVLLESSPDISVPMKKTKSCSMPVVVTVGGSPNLHSGHLKDAGITVIHVVSSVHQARSAEARGHGGDPGGHPIGALG